MNSKPIDEALESELGVLLRAGREREVIERLHREAGLSFRRATAWIKNHRIPSLYDPPRPCPYCGEWLRTNRAQQCFHCGKDWHSTSEVVGA
jgi:hypothetical protein